MKVTDFPEINLDKTGTYRVISEELLVELLKNNLYMSLASPGMAYLIRHFRKQRSYSQKDLAQKVGVDQKHIDKLEQSSIKKPSDDLMKKLKTELGTEFSRLADLI